MSNSDEKYKVGFGKPPKSTQFQKGRSGNPGGRPRKKQDISSQLREVQSEKILMHEGNATVEMTVEEIGFRAQVNKAMVGDITATDTVMKEVIRYDKATSTSPPRPAENGGYMLIPDTANCDDWEKKAIAQQAQLIKDTNLT